MEWMKGYMTKYFPNDIPGGRITHLHAHSDNARQHFKSTGALEFFTTLMLSLSCAATGIKCSYVYSFGAPGHGKGVFDGYGGVMKLLNHNSIRGSKTDEKKILGTLSGYINTVQDVHDALKQL
jgi:hypothetical protein